MFWFSAIKIDFFVLQKHPFLIFTFSPHRVEVIISSPTPRNSAALINCLQKKQNNACFIPPLILSLSKPK
jgi:hypothetical protein